MENQLEPKDELSLIETQIQNINSHSREIQRFFDCINAGTYPGSCSADLEKIKLYFRSIHKQLEEQLDEMASRKVALEAILSDGEQ